MKIAIATMKGGLEDDVSSIMGRCKNFTIVEVEGEEIKKTEIIENTFADAAGGAGIQASQLVAEQGVEAVIAGNFGPKAFGVLDAAGIKLIQAQGNVKEVVMKYVKGELKNIESPSSPAYGGMGPGMGRGMGQGGFGRGIRKL